MPRPGQPGSGLSGTDPAGPKSLGPARKTQAGRGQAAHSGLEVSWVGFECFMHFYEYLDGSGFNEGKKGKRTHLIRNNDIGNF